MMAMAGYPLRNSPISSILSAGDVRCLPTPDPQTTRLTEESRSDYRCSTESGNLVGDCGLEAERDALRPESFDPMSGEIV